MSPKLRVGVMISGRGSNMASILAAAEAPDCPYEVVLVASNNPDAAGLAFADARGVAIWAHDHRGMKRAEFDRLIDAALRAANVEMIALCRLYAVAFVRIRRRLAGPNPQYPPSLLPKYKGLDTHARAIEAGDAEAGCSVHVVTPELDDGPVVAQVRVPILAGDTPETLAERVLKEEHHLYPAALAKCAADVLKSRSLA